VFGLGLGLLLELALQLFFCVRSTAKARVVVGLVLLLGFGKG
jgi:hypothetical protein